MIYKVAGFIVDRGRFELSRDGEPIALQPRAMRLLLMLLEADGRLVTKAQIVAAIWDGRAISDSALTSQVKALRKALGDTLRPCRIVGTVHAEGLRILAPIETRRPAAELPARGGEAENIGAIGAQPSIAVLPLDLLRGDGPPPIVAEALPAEIIDALARMRWLKVIARVSSFGMRGPGDDLDHVRERLGADYCLSGLVETAGDRLKVGVELADTRDRSVVWTQRYEAGLEEVHALREEIVGSVVSNIEITVPQHEMKLTRLRDPDSLTAWELYHTGMGRLLSPSRLAVQPIEDAFRRAFAIDPDFARAHAGLSELCWRQLKEQIELRPERLALLLSKAEHAAERDPDDPFVSLVRGRASFFQQRPEDTDFWFRRAIEKGPSFALAHYSYGNVLMFRDDPEPARRHLLRAAELSPLDPDLHRIYALLATANAMEGEFGSAAEWSSKAMALPHGSLLVTQVALCTMHLAGREKEALELAQRIGRMGQGTDMTGAMQIIPVSPVIRELVERSIAHYGLN